MKYLVVAAMVAALNVGAGVQGAQADHGHGHGSMESCVWEDGSGGPRPCVWDGRHMGTGGGKSYIVRKNMSVRYITHRRAHWLAGY